MSSPTCKKVLKLHMLALEIALPVIQEFIVNNALDGAKYKDFTDFLQQHMHQIYHLFVNVRCCKCEPEPMKSKSGRKITMPQLRKLYIVDQSLTNVKHLIRTKGSISQQCMCGVSVNNNCTLNELDISFIHAIFKECVNLEQDHMMWLDKINEQRNKLCHIGDLSELTESQTNTMWGYLDGSIVGLASAVPPYPDYMEGIQRQIALLEKDAIDDVKAVIDVMKMERKSMQSEINDNMNVGFDQLEKHLSSDIRGTHEQVLASNTEISTQLVAMNKDLQFIKGNVKSHESAEMQLDKEPAPKLNSIETHDGICIRDIKLAALQTETKACKDSCQIIYQRSPGSEDQDIDCHKEIGLRCHPAPVKLEARGSEKGYPVAEDKLNVGDIRTHSASAASTDTSSYSDLELSLGAGRYSGSFTRDCSSCKLLMQTINCEETKQFWKEIENDGPNADQNCHVKFFGIFLKRLKDAFPKEEGLKTKSTINLLIRLLNVDQKDSLAVIKLSNLKRITDLFGSIKKQDDRCALIYQLHLLIRKSLKKRDKDQKIKSSWFVGEMTREVAENCLLAPDCADTSFLVRISSTDGEDGDFALSVRHQQHCHHLKIQGDPKTALSESPYNAHLKFAGQEFSSLPEVINYVTQKLEIEIDTENQTGDCSSVTCIKVFTKSPLNSAMSDYGRTK